MGAIRVKFHNEQEEKVLLTILDSLNYDYEDQYTSGEEKEIEAGLNRSFDDISNGRVSSDESVRQRINAKLGI
jgi:hypothetical protein